VDRDRESFVARTGTSGARRTDEPSGYRAVTRLIENLRMLESDLGLLLVSHDREVVRHADEVYEIENRVALRQRSLLSREQP
jgi:ABC-type lipoprotein export system ATPase subunit